MLIHIKACFEKCENSYLTIDNNNNERPAEKEVHNSAIPKRERERVWL